MATIEINEVSVSGSDVQINNGRVIIDGVDMTPDMENITVVVKGDVKRLNIAACRTLEIEGNVAEVRPMSGNVKITGNVEGNVNVTHGDVAVGGDVRGKAETLSGDIHIKGSVGGKVRTLSGDVSIGK